MTFNGCYTALITPLKVGKKVDYEGLKELVSFQLSEGVKGVLATGTTGESPTLSWEEHLSVIKKTFDLTGDRKIIAGTGSNSSDESMHATQECWNIGVRNILLVDPYYNGPSSLEIRREYIEPVAEKFSDIEIIPYIIPGRTGTQMLPQDLAILYCNFRNVRAVKEATGSLENAAQIRRCCGENFDILSGDDDMTLKLMLAKEVKASGVISVMSNIAPKAVQEMTVRIREGKVMDAETISKGLKPLFEIVTVKTREDTPFGEVVCKARNPLPCKTLMQILGIPSGPCRKPLGKMTKKGINIIVEKARKVYEDTPFILEPLESFFDIKLEDRLYNPKFWRELSYESY